MAEQIVMPQLGESVVEGQVVEWFVKPGDRVESGDVLLEVETEKANTEVPATSSGYVGRLLVSEGDTVNVGEPLIELTDAPGESAPSPADEPEPETEPDTNTEPEPTADDSTGSDRSEPEQERSSEPETRAEPSREQRLEAPTTTRGGSVSRPSAGSQDDPPIVRPAPSNEGARTNKGPWNANNIVAAPTGTPAALPMAQRSLTGRAIAEVLSPAAPGKPHVAPVAPAGPYGAPMGGTYYKHPVVRPEPEDTVIPFTKRRGIIAEHMVYSKHVSPHVPCFAEVDVTDAMNLRRKHKARMAEHGVRLSFLAFVLKATCEALREYPEVNAVVGADEIIQRGSVHLGVAVETPGGLLVPVIRHADTLSVGGLAKAVDEVATRARNKKISVDELTGGTFTVSNPGRKGNLFGAAIINQPQVGILRMGEIRRQPVVREIDGDEAICIRSMMFLGLSYDHRIIDGVTGNGFLYEIRERLEKAAFDV